MLLDLKAALLAHGLTHDNLARKLAMLLEAQCPKWNAETEDWDIFSDGSIQAEALQMAYKLHDAFPAPKEPPPPIAPVTIIFNTDLSGYKEQINATHQKRIGFGIQDQPQGDAGSGTSAEASARGRIRDAEKSEDRTQK